MGAFCILPCWPFWWARSLDRHLASPRQTTSRRIIGRHGGESRVREELGSVVGGGIAGLRSGGKVIPEGAREGGVGGWDGGETCGWGLRHPSGRLCVWGAGGRWWYHRLPYGPPPGEVGCGDATEGRRGGRWSGWGGRSIDILVERGEHSSGEGWWWLRLRAKLGRDRSV